MTSLLAWDANDGRITRRKSSDAPAEKRHDDRVPFRAFRFLRGDQLDGVLIGKAHGPLTFHLGTQALCEISQGGADGGRFGGEREKSVEIGERVFEVFRRERSEPRAQSGASDQLFNRGEKRQLLNGMRAISVSSAICDETMPAAARAFRFENARRRPSLKTARS